MADNNMKTVLCFGDSNTWGYIPETGERYPRTVRWPGVMQAELGEAFHVIEEGLNGRTTVWDDPIEGYKNGRNYLIPCLASHAPIDVMTIMLGTNDLKTRFSLSAFDIAEGAGVLVRIAQASESGPVGTAPRILLIAPPGVGKLSFLDEMFAPAPQNAPRLAAHFRRVAEETGCEFLDAGSLIRASDEDGIHLTPESHRVLAAAVTAKIREMV